jgi:signal transduction histidine kinase
MIRREATRCRQITSRLLDFSRMGHAACENTDLVTLVRQVVAVAGHLPQHRGKRVEVVAPAALPACVKPGEIEQVVLNLLANALEAVEADGRVQIEVREAAGEALLVVRDNGCGLSDEVRQKLFEPFFTRRKSGQGTGLGLTIAERIVRDHGGQIEAESQGPGQGSTFRVRLPLRLSTAPAEIRKTPVAAARDLTLG